MEALGIDPKLLTAQLINYGVFFAVFYFFVSKPFFKYIQNQRDQEKERERISEALQKREEEMKAEQEKMKQEMKKELEAAIVEAKEEAAKAKEELIAKAKKESEEIVEKSRKQLIEEREELVREMKDKTIELSVMIVSKALGDYLSGDAQKHITKNILEKVSKQELNV